ncbi:PEP-CTERM sorting domain-containing protein [Methyloversatilis thermotolerans]|uniref:PEP-CTERM sorting domain-containing protein n=1 Tax=Methyloversatilis thermotolerans TaxID=1346290 RepID=UPI00036E20E6|nr:PEP-CTERM sorting domain-containing protein [Methyloversatilis thermotolerans]
MMKHRTLIAAWLTGTLIGVAGAAQAATATATLDWFSLEFQHLSLDPDSGITPSFTADNFYSYVSTNMGFIGDWQESHDWMSDLSSHTLGAHASITGAAFPDKALNDDGTDPDWRLIPNPLESLDARVDTSGDMSGANVFRDFTLEIDAQSVLLVSFDYLLTYDLGPLGGMAPWLFTRVGIEAQNEGFLSYSEAILYADEDAGSEIRQGRLVFALVNASDEAAQYDVSAFAGVYAAAVPEPSALAMLLAGLGLVGRWARRIQAS